MPALRVIWTDEGTGADGHKLNKSDLEDLVDFLEKFMEGNGQWEYIKRHEWYTSGEYAIGIDVRRRSARHDDTRSGDSGLDGGGAGHTPVHLAEKEDLQVQDLGFEMCVRAWRELYSGTEGAAHFLHDAKTRALAPWRITGRYSEANAQDDRLAQSESIDEPPVSLSRLRRTNSREHVQQELQKAREAGKGKPRAFIRTWVRILRNDDEELSKFTFEPI